MSILGWLSGGAVKEVGNVIDSLHTSNEEKLEAQTKFLAFQTELFSKCQELETRQIEAQAAIVRADAQGESFLQRNWRPITMLVFVFIIFNNYILAPYIQFFTLKPGPMLEIPPDMWQLLQWGIAGYIGFRSLEKSTVLPNLIDFIKSKKEEKKK